MIITTSVRKTRFDRDRLLLGAYCFPKDESYAKLREWFAEAGFDFYIGAGGEELTKEDFSWLAAHNIGVIAPNTEYYRTSENETIWGIDLRDEPGSGLFADLSQDSDTLYGEAADRLPPINLLPMYASAEQIEETAKGPFLVHDAKPDVCNSVSAQYRKYVKDYIRAVDSNVISADIYPLEAARDTGRLETYEYWLRNLDILADAARACGRDLWVITQAAGNFVDGEGVKRYCDTAEDQRWQNYVSLAFGAKAIIPGCFYRGWWDPASHMVNNEGERTDTFDAVKQVNGEILAFARTYGRYENHGAVMYHGAKRGAAGAALSLIKVDKAFRPEVKTSDPLLCGCFSEKDGSGKAFVFTNMYEPETGSSAAFSATFTGAKSLTVYRKRRADKNGRRDADADA